MKKSKRVGWVRYAARMGSIRNVYKVSVGKSEVKTLLGTRRRLWENNTKVELRKIRSEGVDWIRLA
jgi:hypothetical protein